MKVARVTFVGILVCSSVFAEQLRVIDTLGNCLVFDNRGAIGLQNNAGGGDFTLGFPFGVFAAELDTTSPAYLFDGSPIISVGGVVTEAMFDTDTEDSTSFRPLTAPSSDTNLTWFHSHSGDFCNYDTTLGLSVELWQRHTAEVNTPTSAFRVIYGRTALFNLSGATIDSVKYAWAWDWNVPSDSGSRNTSGIVTSGGLNYYWQNGFEFGADTGNSSLVDARRRWAAARYMGNHATAFPAYTGAGGGKRRVGFKAHFARDNALYIGDDWDHKKLDSVLKNITGFGIGWPGPPDSVLGIDFHMVMNSGLYNVGPADTLYFYWLAVTGISSTSSQSELQSVISATNNSLFPVGWKIADCAGPAGDADDNSFVNIADVSFLISRIFAGGLAPNCCEQADANGNGAVNIADVSYLIDGIFNGGPEPVLGPAGLLCGN